MKKKVTGIIVEYNPLHSGHLLHLNKARELTGCDLVVACMSGNFVQRGEPAVIDKWARSKAAVLAGVNVVFELPFPFVVQSASQYGAKAVELLHLAGIDHLVFGSETNNLEELTEISQMSFNVDNFRENMKQGYSYPASYGYMADSYGPNDILAISYLKALQNYPEITPVSILREGNYHDKEICGTYPSATALREALRKGQDVSAYTPLYNELKDYPEVTLEKLYPYIRAQLLTTSPDELRQYFLMNEGIENHLQKKARDCDSWDKFINETVTKRYTRSRIQRTLCHLLVHNKTEDMHNLPPMDRLRPLAWDEKGRAYLDELQKQGTIIVNHFTQQIKPYRQLEYKSSVIYGMLMNEEDRYKVVRGEICGQFLKPR